MMIKFLKGTELRERLKLLGVTRFYTHDYYRPFIALFMFTFVRALCFELAHDRHFYNNEIGWINRTAVFYFRGHF